MARDSVFKCEKNINQKEESKMSNRRVVNIQLLDNDKGLPVEFSLVGSWDGVVTEDSDAITVQEIISTGEVVKLIDQHNTIRKGEVNLDILNRTGNEVKLRPIKLKDLTWVVK